jgi:hypothetical protein
MPSTQDFFIAIEERAKIEQILWDYSHYLHKRGYIDSDYYTEEPNPIDEFLKTYN